MDEMKTIRKAIERLIDMVRDNYHEDRDRANGCEVDGCPICASMHAARAALAALSRLAEPGEDARELAQEFDPFARGEFIGVDKAAALIERYAAAREARVREEERARIGSLFFAAGCADKLRMACQHYKTTTGELGPLSAFNRFRAAINETPPEAN